MAVHDPIAICILACLMDLNTALHIPKAHCSILRVGEQNLHPWMEHDAWDVACVALQGVHLPMFVTWKAPKLNSLIISSRCKNLHRWMEADPVDSFLVAFQNVLDLHFWTSVQLTWPWTLLLHAQLFKLEEIPDPYGLIQTAACDKRVFRMELCTHDIVRVACQYS